MFKRLSLFMLSLLLVIIAAACGSNGSSKEAGSTNGSNKANEEVTVKHELGETKVKKNPKKVVVFDFGVLDTLDKFGVDIAGLPKENIPKYLSKYEEEKYANTGSLKEPDFEKIHEIGPDLIIISGRQMDLYEQFAEIAPTIYMAVDPNNYIDSFKKNVNTLAEIFGKEDVAKEELGKIDEAIASLNEKAKTNGKNALIILANDGKVSAYGPKSRFGLIHDVFGIPAVDENIEVSTHGQSISFEYIVEKDPDYLFVIDRGAVVGGQSSAKQVVENDLVKTTNAYKSGNIVYLNPDIWYLSGGGLVSVMEMVKEVEGALK
ncbi:iron complex transport system substrate-binding protein [Anoxybacillus vitaminiphilus]|uniref:Iron complex transport system substrate-binding protein n=1 Tax=Paranoxybacillus vitaminiphilus TaxID=581036 RepID=A0A327YC86_9BACL|nr:siderophore ABC transporter substrate-binding protein [Anoxybacillus vitaminiphilus]RAK18688.1 iron complex transport system substrate-binding protein [Anoxybacillus vitaminiphilus]